MNIGGEKKKRWSKFKFYGGGFMTILEAYSILKSTKPARCERDRYHQRDELQHLLIPHLPVDDRDKFERAMNRHFRL